MSRKTQGQEIGWRITDGERQLSLEDIMRIYGNDVLRFAYSYVKDYQTAEDIFQEVFIKVNGAAPQFRGECSVKTWLLRITSNTCKDFLKSAYSRHVTLFAEGEEENLSVDDMTEKAEQKEQSRKVREAVLSLPEEFREVLLCLYFEELSVKETAEALGIRTGTVKSRLSRARERLRVLLSEKLEKDPVSGKKSAKEGGTDEK